jgi:hypothetical protein
VAAVTEAARSRVALVLAVGISLAVILVTAGVLYDAIFSEGPGLSDNATQLLTTAFGGIIGVLGSYLGFVAASHANEVARAPNEKSAGGDAQGGEPVE